MKLVFLLFLVTISHFANNLDAVNADAIRNIFDTTSNPFNYDLQLKILPGNKKDAELLICLHGMGGDATLCNIMRSNPVIPYHIVAFNFPDYGLRYSNFEKTTFGTFEEIAPALFVLKKSIIDGGADKVHLYGFSAGGGAVINVLATLNSNDYDSSLKKLGIDARAKQTILKSIQQGSVVLEVPLKSFDEIVDTTHEPEIQALAERARKNGMIPIENIEKLRGLSLNVFLYFANPDKVLGNRDDAEFIKRIKDANKNGQTVAIIGRNSGHISYHPELWNAYKIFVDKREQ